MSHARLSLTRTAVLGAVIALGMTSGCSSPKPPVNTPTASAAAKKLTSVEKQQVEVVSLALGDPDPDAVFPHAKRLGTMVNAKRSGPLHAAYDSKLKPGQAVKVDVACTGGGAVTVTVFSGKRAKTAKTDCPDDSSFPESLFFEAGGSRVNVTVIGHGKGAMGTVVHGLDMDTGMARDLILANRAHSALTNEGPGLGTSSGSLRDGINGSSVDVKIGQRVRVQAACVGTGSVTVSAVSGTARVSKRYPCGNDGSVGAPSFQLTAVDPVLKVRLTPDKGASGGAAYTVRDDRS
ncbi:hypothetical protein ABT272_44080 [Streptomyces sp900105245]|uniref:Lipoprotein n=1 Tax=Streptomyces sp. 900105245 TaxID=3154379 RepID=A0ABV1ULB3_9ACTN